MRTVEEMLSAYGQMVWAVCCRTAGPALAEDPFQEVFLAAAQLLARNEKIWSWEGMLRRLAVAKSVDALRRRIRDRNRLSNGVDTLPSSDNPPDRRLHHTELAGHMRQALLQLPPAHAEIFLLRHVEDRSYEEIAQAMNMTPNAVGAALSRAKSRLRELLEPQTEKGQVFHE